MALPDPHEEAFGAALTAIDHVRPLLPWYARRVLRKFGSVRTTIAQETARRVEHRTRLLVAREIDTLDDPAWAQAITTAKQLILAKPAGGLIDEWWTRLPAYSGTSASNCPKCGPNAYGCAARYMRHVIRPAGCESAAVFGECLVRACGQCGYEWQERCADATEAYSGPQGAESGPGDAADAEAPNEAHSAPKESGTGHPSPERPADAHSDAETPVEALAARETLDDAQGATEPPEGRHGAEAGAQ